METNLTPSLSWLAPLFSAVVSVLFFALLGHGLRKVRGTNAVSAISWWAAASVAGGSGLWAAQFMALGGLVLPWDMHYSPAALGIAWGAAIVGVGAVLGTARLPSRGSVRMGLQALLLAGLWLGLFVLARHSLGVQPLGDALASLWTPGSLIVMASVLGLGLMFDARALSLGRFSSRQWLAAGMFGLVAGMAQDLALSGLKFGVDSAVRGDATVDTPTVWLAVAACALVILLGLLGALVDAQAHGRNALLASSLSEANRRLREQALADPLTRLPNRLMFEERLEDSLTMADEHGTGELAVMFIDLDGFKPINDSFGHVAGDAVLAEVGKRLASITRPSDLAARVGGDEFLLLLNKPGANEAVAQVALRVLQAIGKQYRLPNGVDVNLSCSIGIVMYPEHGPGKKLLANADAAMYAAKRAGGSTFAFFAPAMEQDARVQLELQHDLRTALDRHELELYYQPKVHALSGQITGVEALARWRHPTRGLIMPDAFIPVAERFGLIGTLGNWVIEEACRQMRAWMDDGLRMRVAVNLSMHQLRQDDLVPRIRSAMARYRIEAELLTFEITESVAMEDITMEAFNALAGVGVSLSIDDFGTAYSNFAALRKLPAKQLKIDRSLFTDIDQSSDALAVVDAMIKMAHALGLKVVAEGVETEAQRDLLLALNCDELQGFLYAKPMSASTLTLWAMSDEGETHPVDFRPSIYTAMVDAMK
ncbi:MAG: EAL domain-containing protein [Vitreoscilla sp.]|nr:EAL domain-containing protein [Vitreoscilla sp.]MBP6675558.1 EAL domain-containing protein [Vitreoscilla sp.]